MLRGSKAPDGYKVPCGYLLAAVNYEGKPIFSPSTTRAIQADRDFPGLAANLGFVACHCGATDGTVDCAHRKASDMIRGAAEYLDVHSGAIADFPEIG